MNPRLPRLALSVVGKPSFIRKRLEALREFGSNPFHPRRAMFAGLAVTLGIVAVMTIMFGQQERHPALESFWRKPQDWKQIAEVARYRSSDSKFEKSAMRFPSAVLTYPIFYLNNTFIWKHGQTTVFGNQYEEPHIIAFFLDQKGLVMFSMNPFSDAQPIGKIEGNTLWVQGKGLDLKIESMTDILPINAVVYVKHDPNYTFEQFRSQVREYKEEGFFHQSGYETQMPTHNQKQHWGMRNIRHVADMYEVSRKPNLGFKYPKMTYGNESWMPMAVKSSNICYRFQDSDQYIFMHSKLGTIVLSYNPIGRATQIFTEGRLIKIPLGKGEVVIESKEQISNSFRAPVWFEHIKMLPNNAETETFVTWDRNTLSCKE